MEIKELREKSIGELKKILKESEDKLRDFGFKVAQKQLKNIREIRVIKKLVARIYTVLKEKEDK